MRQYRVYGIACSLLLFSCLFYRPQIPGYFYDDGYYKNSSVGFKVKVPHDWTIATTPRSALSELKPFFARLQSKASELLFVGMNQNKRCGIRCIAESSDTTLEAYFKDLYYRNEAALVPLRADYHKAGDLDVVEWSYYTTATGGKYRFCDYVFNTGAIKVRLSFWTLSGLYDDYKKVFTETFQTLYLAKDASDTTGYWRDTPLGAVLEKPEVTKIIEYATSKKELHFSDNGIDTICTDSDKSFLWRVTGGAVPCYLFGSIHMLKPEMYPLKRNIEEAFDSSESIVLELDSQNPRNVKKITALAQQGVFTGDSTIRQAIAEPLYDSLLSYTEKYGLPAANLGKLRPWMVALVLQQLQMKALGLSPEYGVEHYFLKKKSKREVLELETVEEQMNLFTSMQGEEFLRYTLHDIEKTEEKMAVLIKSWSCGNVEVMQSVVFSDMANESEAMVDKLMYSRNLKMANKIDGLIKSGKRCFVVVGSAHLIGERSVVEHLQKAGYTVEQL